jgi:HPt (histidine-containing phosphotransfer) domain-containing protein
MDVDTTVFDNLVAEIGLEDAQQTFSIFISETDDRLKRFRQLSCDKDRDAIKQEAHGLKGTAGNFGLRQVSELARKLEQDAATIMSGAYEATLRSLETSYATARERVVKLAT